MKTITLFLFLFSILIEAKARNYGENIKDWKIITGENNYYIQKLDKEPRMFKISSIGGLPKIKKIIEKKQSPDIIYVIYYAGSAGTSHIITSYRAVAFNLKKNKFLGDLAYEYKSEQGEKVYQPSWRFKDGKLIVEDESYNSKKTIPIK